MSMNFNSYNVYARFLPALILMVPIIVETILVLFIFDMISIGYAAIMSTLLTILGYIFLPLIRNKGVSLQEKMFLKWGGSPTTKFLRYSDAEYKCTTRTRGMIVTLFPEYVMPTEDEEQNNPDDADERYEEIISALRSATRDQSKFNILFDANKMYGFVRNTLAIKSWTIIFSLIFFLINNILLCSEIAEQYARELIVGNILLIVYVTIVLCVFTKKAYKKQVDNYLSKLIEGLKILYHDKQEMIVKR